MSIVALHSSDSVVRHEMSPATDITFLSAQSISIEELLADVTAALNKAYGHSDIVTCDRWAQFYDSEWLLWHFGADTMLDSVYF